MIADDPSAPYLGEIFARATDFAWIAEDNSPVPMDAQTTFAFGQAAMAHKQRMIFEARQIKNAIMAADDEAGARAAAEVVWPSARP